MTDQTVLATRADRRLVASEATRVTFFEDRAEVQRKAACEVPAGVSWVAIAGVTVALDDPSLVASVQGDRARVTAARVVRRVREESGATEAEVAAMEADMRVARVRAFEADRALDRSRSALERARALEATWIDAVKQVPSGGDDLGAMAGRWRASWDSFDKGVSRLLDEVSTRARALDAARLDLGRAEARHAHGRQVHPRHEAVVEVQVEAREACTVEVVLVYRTPCALWRPEHLFRLVARPEGGHDLVVRTWATAWQSTGEAWHKVACRFSTARPAQSAAAPLVTDDVLVLRRKSDHERRTVTVEAREQAVAVAGLQRGVRAVEEMPGVEDGGEALWFEASRPATIPSDGAPARVEVSSVTVPCEVDRVAFPERTVAVHVRATATLTGESALLAGPVVVARGSEVVGRGRTGYIGRGEPFEAGFGVDDGLRVRRHVDERRETTAVLGTQKVTRTVRLYVSNLSGEARRVTVTERVPVSEVKDVEVALTQLGGARHDAKDGFLKWELDVAPRGTHELSFVYRIEAASKVALPF